MDSLTPGFYVVDVFQMQLDFPGLYRLIKANYAEDFIVYVVESSDSGVHWCYTNNVDHFYIPSRLLTPFAISK